MRQLIRKDPGHKLLSPTEWWLIGDSLEVVISYDEQEFSLIMSLLSKNGRYEGDPTLKTAQFLLERGYKFRITFGIDCHFIVISNDKDTLESILSTLENTTLESILSRSEIDVKKYIRFDYGLKE